MVFTFNYATASSAFYIAGIASYKASSAILASLSAFSLAILASFSFSAAISDSFATIADSFYTLAIKASVERFFSST